MPGSRDRLTVDELAAATGMTVRTTRYYAGLGLLPPPMRSGRMAYYDSTHLARLELIRALQDRGLTLAAIERYLAQIPLDASASELSVERALLTSWGTGRQESLSREDVEDRAGRELSDEEVGVLLRIRAMRRQGDGYELLAPFDTAIKTLDVGIPMDAHLASSAAIGRHMDALVEELTDLLNRQIIEPFQQTRHSDEEAAAFDAKVEQLRQLSLEAVVAGFQLAVDEIIARSRSEASAEARS